MGMISFVSSQKKYHVCEGATKERAAAISGTVRIRGDCTLIITAYYSSIGIRRARKCDKGNQFFKINSHGYCADANSTDSYINTVDEGIVITTDKIRLEKFEPFEIEYFHVPSQIGDHVCDGAAKREKAKPSGTVLIRGKCQLTLYDIVGKIIFDRPRCKEHQELMIANVPFCTDGNSLFTDTNGTGITIEAKDDTPFKIYYFHGKQRACIISHSKE